MRPWIFAALIFSTLVKLYLALFTQGTTDVDAFADHLAKVREFGVRAYHYRGAFDNPFNSPPPMLHVLKMLGYVTDTAGIAFGFWLRLLPILAGVGSFFVAWRLLKDRKDLFSLLLALALCPVSIMVDGYHGNTDSVVIMLVLLSVYLIQERKLYLWAGLAFGLACCVKVVPLMFAPAFLLFLPNMKERIKFAAIASGVFLAASLPYMAQDPMVLRNALGYGPIYGNWGIPQILAIFTTVQYAHQPFEPLGVHGMIAAGLKYLTWIVIVIEAWLMNRKQVSLYQQCGVIISIVLFLAPGFGPQYLVWLVPFVPALGLRPTLGYYTVAGLYLAFKYLGFPDVDGAWPVGFALSIACWLSMFFLFRAYLASRQTERVLVV